MRAKAKTERKMRVVLQPRFRILVQDEIGFGPGKAQLLEAIGRTGSISEAAREMEMSYMRAWKLVKTMNRCFREPLVETVRGGKAQGGAHLTPAGKKVLRLYQSIQRESLRASKREWAELRRYI